MSIERRQELLSWAYQNGAWIIEDDHDAEIRHKGGVQPALKSMDSGDHVIYVGTFSKILFQSLRAGFMVLPQKLIKPAETIRSYTELCPSIMIQPVLARFIQEGTFCQLLKAYPAGFIKVRWCFSCRKAAIFLGSFWTLKKILLVPTLSVYSEMVYRRG